VKVMEKLGKYTNLRMVGKGTMGVVYRAHCDSLGEIAIKAMSADLRGDSRARERFIREARVAASLDHPNIIDIHGMGEEDGRPYIVMEFLDGEDLKAVINRGDEVSLEHRLKLMKQVASALAYAHEVDITHRDIKPENIFVTRGGDVRLLDFEMARIKGSTMTATGAALGTPAYMSPEQVKGKKVDRRSDVFAVGSVLYELLSGQRAFPGERVHEIFEQIIKRHPAALHQHNELLPDSLSVIVAKAMSKIPEHRYQSMDGLLASLESFDDVLAELRDEVRREAEASLARVAEMVAESGRPASLSGIGDTPLPSGYLELHAFVRGLAEEKDQTGAMLGELEWVQAISAASLGDYGSGELRSMANRVDDIRAVCPEESGIWRLGHRLLKELKVRLHLPPHLINEPRKSGEIV
jgi:serine/threonine protein kinase